MSRRLLVFVLLVVALSLAACRQAAPAPATPTAEAAADVDLTAVKQYALDHAAQMKTGTSALAATAQDYYDLLAANQFDYAAAWARHPDELTQLVRDARANWLTASNNYELNEGIIAGVPSLAYYDTWIDAGPSAEEDPQAALSWTLELPDGSSLDSPGNFFHGLLEPTIWGTKPAFTGLAVDLDGDGTITLGEALPDANVLLAAAQGLDGATDEMTAAIQTWQPTVTDAFTALVVMIPTMNEYFEQWKLSAYVAGQNSEEAAFIGTSRLVDIAGILNGLDVTYDNVGVLIADTNAEQHAQIEDGFADLRGYVADLRDQEAGGVVFTSQQADLFGTEAQARATALAGQVAQVAALLDVDIAE
ncbi:MAG: EfeM/EfeO family lipoprotein [Ardenticatenaceae bacterium]|nr:EfeM/EfeO family lipoprotein [Ardenticatenaceae bacterium]